MEKNKKIIKTCANCKHFEMLETGYEIENILDTAYLKSRCKIKNWQTKEYYLAGIKKPYVIEDFDYTCEYWEEWRSENPIIENIRNIKEKILKLFGLNKGGGTDGDG